MARHHSRKGHGKRAPKVIVILKRKGGRRRHRRGGASFVM